MKPLEVNEITALKNRYYCFGDAVIRSLSIVFNRPSAPCKIEIEIGTKVNLPNGDDWANVLFVINDVRSFAIQNGVRGCYQVISDELHILRLEDQFILEFGDLLRAPKSIEDAMSSKFHIVGKSVEWEELPYAE